MKKGCLTFEMNAIFSQKNVRDEQSYVHTFFDLYSFRIIHELPYVDKEPAISLNLYLVSIHKWLFSR